MQNISANIREVFVTRYVTALREGGSLPAIAEADDGFLYVVKFRGAGQGTRALTADFLGAELARAAGLKVPELVFATLDEAFGRTEPDEEIQDLLKASTGLNLGVHYLKGAISYDPAVKALDAELASTIVWLDGLLLNVDRTAKNTNLLCWRKEIWLIDFGASLYFHHSGYDWNEYVTRPFIQVKDHVLLPAAAMLLEINKKMKSIFTEEKIRYITGLIPASWIENSENKAPEVRNLYAEFLIDRVNHSAIFLNEAIHARQKLI